MTSSAAVHLVSRAVPIAIEPVSLHLVRHRRSDMDAAVKLIAELVADITPRLGDQHGGGVAENMVDIPL